MSQSTINNQDDYVQRELVNTEVMKSLDDLDANLVLNKEVPIASVKAAARLGRIGDSWSMIRSPFGVLRRRPQDPAWIDMMDHVGK